MRIFFKNLLIRIDGSEGLLNITRAIFRHITFLPNWMYLSIAIRYSSRKYDSKCKKLAQSNTKIRVAFLVRHASQWKYDDLYRAFESKSNFIPFIVILPDFNNPIWMHDYLLACSRFKAGNYEIINGFDIEKKILIQPDVINPDIVFFTKPLDGDDPFSIVKFSKSLTCYVPYSTYGDNNPKDQYDKFFHNLLWRHYVATKMHIDIASKNSRNNGVNIRVVGYPTGDALINPSDASLCLSKEIWKRAGARKKIIWAPHHTIQESDTETNHSNFLRLADVMIYLAKKYSEVAYFVFKPHPNLRRQLSILKEWGHEKTQKYYEQWELLENGHLEDGDYLALFIGSDALIHDSVSFMAEYIYTLKPCCYIVKNQNQLDKFLNTFGRRLLDLHDLSYSTDDIEKFIVSIVSNASDEKYVHKCAFLSEVLLPANERSAVKNILSDIESVLSARQ